MYAIWDAYQAARNIWVSSLRRPVLDRPPKAFAWHSYWHSQKLGAY